MFSIRMVQPHVRKVYTEHTHERIQQRGSNLARLLASPDGWTRHNATQIVYASLEPFDLVDGILKRRFQFRPPLGTMAPIFARHSRSSSRNSSDGTNCDIPPMMTIGCVHIMPTRTTAFSGVTSFSCAPAKHHLYLFPSANSS
jgi:hypothetical protein